MNSSKHSSSDLVKSQTLLETSVRSSAQSSVDTSAPVAPELLAIDEMPRAQKHEKAHLDAGMSGSNMSGGASAGAGFHSVYLHGVQLKSTDPVMKALLKVYGIGHSRALQICRSFSRSTMTILGERSSDQRSRIETWISERFVIESERRRAIYEDIKHLTSISSNRGIRLRNGRPVRGQRTSSNAMTASRLNRQRVK